MTRRVAGEGSRSKEGKYFRYEVCLDGTRYVRKATTKAELERKISALRNEIALQSPVCRRSTEVTFGMAFDRFLEVRVIGIGSPNTRLSYESLRRNHLADFERRSLARLDAPQLQHIADQLRLQGKTRTGRYAVDVVHRVLEFAKTQGWIAANIADGVEKPLEKPRQTKILKSNEIALILEEAEQRWLENRFRYFPLVLFLLNTAARISEALAIRDLDVRSEPRNSVYLQWQLYRQGGAWEFRDAKQHSKREIALNAGAMRAIELARVQRNRDQVLAGEAYREHLLVFPDEMGGPVLRSVPYHALRRLQQGLGLGHPVSLHELRHTFLSYVAREAPLHVVSRIAGHKSLRTTERYLHVLQDDMDKAIRSVNLGGGKAP